MNNFINLRYSLLFFLVCGFLMAGLLVGPRVPADQQRIHCVDNIKIGEYFGISLNCDSSEFMRLANNPELLLEKESIRQSRPGLIYAASLFTNLIKSGIPNYKNILSKIEETEKLGKTNQGRILKNGPAYSAYILINIIIAFAAFTLFLNVINKGRELERSKLPITFIIGIICFFWANDVVKAFAWSPHTQYFNILGPVLSVWCISRVLNGRLESFAQQKLLSLLIGLMLLCYGAMVVCGVCLIGAILFKSFDRKDGDYIKIFGKLLPLIILMLTPYLVWFAYVMSINGEFFSAETRTYNQIFWIFDAIIRKDLSFISTWIGHFFANIIAGFSSVIFLIVIIFAAFYVLYKYKNIHSEINRMRNDVIACFATVFIYLSFYATVGISGARFAVVFVMPLVILASLLFVSSFEVLKNESKSIYSKFFMSIGILSLVFTVGKSGPWS